MDPRVLSGKMKNKGWRNLVRRLNLQSTLQTGKKELATGNLLFNPFKGSLTDTSLITLNNVVANTLSFNRFSSKWGMDISNGRNLNKSLLTYGFESRKLNDWTVKGRWNISRQYSLELIQKRGNLLT